MKNGRGFIPQASSRDDVVVEEKGQPWVGPMKMVIFLSNGDEEMI